MKKINIFILLPLLLCLSLSAEKLYAQEKPSTMPAKILFNGYLTDKEGNGLSYDNCNFTINIYDSTSSKTPVWREVYQNIIVTNGEFTLPIGNDDKSPLSFNKKYYLGIQINDEEEMPQRLEFGTSAYSLGAKYASSVADSSITTEKIQDNSITSDKIRSLTLSKIINLPDSLSTIEKLKAAYRLAGSDYEWWTTFGNIIYGPERHFIGTINDRDFVIRTYEIQRMRFDAYGYILLGTVEHPVDFEVFGLSIFDYLFIDGKLGVGIDPALAKMHINAPPSIDPLRIDYQDNPVFTIDKSGRVEITSTLSGGDDNAGNYPLLVSGSDHGVGIDIAGNADGDNNYVSFWDDNGMAGRIEGQTAGEYASEPANIATDAFLAALIAAEVVAAVSYLYPLPIPTEPADIIRCAADIAEISFNMAWDYAHLGITYESGSGDYAEWLEKDDLNEAIFAGDIVAVNGGKITKNTSNAEKLMAISTSPIVLGNMKEKSKEKEYEKVVFMGQIPVKVRGVVYNGYFIIPSGLGDGTGIAIAPELMTIDELDKIVGRSWAQSSVESVKLINIRVGVTASDIAQVAMGTNTNHSIKVRSEEINKHTSELKSKLEHLKSKLNNINNP